MGVFSVARTRFGAFGVIAVCVCVCDPSNGAYVRVCLSVRSARVVCCADVDRTEGRQADDERRRRQQEHRDFEENSRSSSTALRYSDKFKIKRASERAQTHARTRTTYTIHDFRAQYVCMFMLGVSLAALATRGICCAHSFVLPDRAKRAEHKHCIYSTE